MTAYLVGTTAENYIPQPVKIISIMVSAGAAGADFHIYDGQLKENPASIHIHGAASWTEQYTWRGIPFPNGFTAHPETGITSYIVEYEPL